MGGTEGNGNTGAPTPEQRDVARLMDDWQHRAPAGPDFTQPTIDFVNEGVALALERGIPILKGKLPGDTTEIDAKLGNAELVDTNKWTLIPGFQVTKDDLGNIIAMRMMVPNRPGEQGGRWISTDFKSETNGPLLTTLADLDPRLGVGEYILALKFPQPRDVLQTFNDFTIAFNRIRAIIGEDTPLTDPRVQVIAAAYVIQVAKGKVVDATKGLVGQVQRFENQPSLNAGIIDNLKKKIDAIHVHGKYLIVAKGILNAFAENTGFAPEQMQLLYDIAFMDRDKLGGEQGAGVYEVLVRNAFAEDSANTNWPALFAQRDFLVRYVGDAFPDWRQRIMREQVGGEFSKTFENLLENLSDGSIAMDSVPEGLRDALERSVKNYSLRESTQFRKDIMPQTVSFLKDLMRKLMPPTYRIDLSEIEIRGFGRPYFVDKDFGPRGIDIGERLYELGFNNIDTTDTNQAANNFMHNIIDMFYAWKRSYAGHPVIAQLKFATYLEALLPERKNDPRRNKILDLAKKIEGEMES